MHINSGHSLILRPLQPISIVVSSSPSWLSSGSLLGQAEWLVEMEMEERQWAQLEWSVWLTAHASTFNLCSWLLYIAYPIVGSHEGSAVPLFSQWEQEVTVILLPIPLPIHIPSCCAITIHWPKLMCCSVDPVVLHSTTDVSCNLTQLFLQSTRFPLPLYSNGIIRTKVIFLSLPMKSCCKNSGWDVNLNLDWHLCTLSTSTTIIPNSQQPIQMLSFFQHINDFLVWLC